jgi:hypothetical protein
MLILDRRAAKIPCEHDRPVRRYRPSSAAGVIVSLHVATGALAGRLAATRLRAVALGALAHAAGDRLPHQDVASRRFEIASGAAGIALLAGARGPLDPTVLGAVAASVPDVEHVLRLPRPGGRKLFPSHRVRGWHRSGGVPAWAQVAVAGLVLGALAGRRRRGPGDA